MEVRSGKGWGADWVGDLNKKINKIEFYEVKY